MALGKPLLAFVHVEAAGWGKSERLMQVCRFPEVEEMHWVAGDASVIFKLAQEALAHWKPFSRKFMPFPV